MMILYFTVAVLLFVVVYFRLYLYLFPKNRLVILMYHQIAERSTEDLTVSVKNLEEQFKYISKKKYNPKFFNELHTPSKRSIIITFDDGYKNNEVYLPALLEKYKLKATIFIPTEFIQKGYKDNEMMTFEDIRNLDRDYFEIALHSHSHQNFRNVSADFIENDLQKNMQILDNENIQYSKVIAYPYGKYPKKNPEKAAVFSVLKQLGILYALRIGNKINYFPSQNPYELCRIDIKGKDTLIHFKLKLIFGRLKMF
ncbi:Polysaccharide deacetylase [Chryseobacterium taichungense]|uniref:Polysaccharide deacetylase n=1 Tax=Chryseobacterium taichungense TaxID=295069 RepID=A0A1H7WFQ0_9FLAO|nr:polysaccharide deacetylase family protein [Chryseobacterium taichungense]SEM20422.1 Polysaccharide deacetylase [Chryseobacterium taichungense]